VIRRRLKRALLGDLCVLVARFHVLAKDLADDCRALLGTHKISEQHTQCLQTAGWRRMTSTAKHADDGSFFGNFRRLPLECIRSIYRAP
jgi:hypothetical protein